MSCPTRPRTCDGQQSRRAISSQPCEFGPCHHICSASQRSHPPRPPRQMQSSVSLRQHNPTVGQSAMSSRVTAASISHCIHHDCFVYQCVPSAAAAARVPPWKHRRCSTAWMAFKPISRVFGLPADDAMRSATSLAASSNGGAAVDATEAAAIVARNNAQGKE